VNGDACSNTCLLEIACGNGLITSGENCDDGNTSPNDGCSSCSIDIGYSCSSNPSICTPICGDGLIKGTEICDDNDSSSNDGCSSLCQIESGYIC